MSEFATAVISRGCEARLQDIETAEGEPAPHYIESAAEPAEAGERAQGAALPPEPSPFGLSGLCAVASL
jgi:hypothetical protein